VRTGKVGLLHLDQLAENQHFQATFLAACCCWMTLSYSLTTFLDLLGRFCPCFAHSLRFVRLPKQLGSHLSLHPKIFHPRLHLSFLSPLNPPFALQT